MSRICVIYAGLIGGTAKYGAGKLIDFTACAENYKKMVFQDHEVDVFCHTWSYKQEKPLRRLLNPVDAIFEAQIQFDTSIVTKHHIKNDRFAVCSKYNSVQKAIRLALNHGKEYDFWMLTRYDILWDVFVPWHTFPKDTLIISNLDKTSDIMREKVPRLNVTLPDGNGRWGHRLYQDLWLIGNREHMEHLSTCYDRIVGMGDCKYSAHGILFKHIYPTFGDDVMFWGWIGEHYELYRRKVMGNWM